VGNLTTFKSLIDKSVNEHTGITCRKGCAFCCSYDVKILVLEGVEILNKIKENGISLNLNSNSCPLLDLNNTCKVYDIRPMSCRKHIVYSDPINCSKDNKGSITRVENKTIESSVETLLSTYDTVNLKKYLMENAL